MEERFFSELRELVPDWEDVNRDPRWLEWLGQVDPLTGQRRQVLLDRARERLNADGMGKLFEEYKNQSNGSVS